MRSSDVYEFTLCGTIVRHACNIRELEIHACSSLFGQQIGTKCILRGSLQMGAFGTLLMLTESFMAFQTIEMFTCSGLMLRRGPERIRNVHRVVVEMFMFNELWVVFFKWVMLKISFLQYISINTVSHITNLSFLHKSKRSHNAT